MTPAYSFTMLNVLLLIIAAVLLKSFIDSKKKDKKLEDAAAKPAATSNEGFIPIYTAIDFNGRTYKATQVRKGFEFDSLETKDLSEFLSFIGDDIVVTYDTPKVRTKLERVMGETFMNHTADVLALARQLSVDVKDYRLETIYEKVSGDEMDPDLTTTYMIFRVFEGLKEFASNSSLKLSANYPEGKWEEFPLDPEDFKDITQRKKRNQAFPDETIAFTGRIEDLVRREAVEKAVRNGAVYSPALTKRVTLLVVGDTPDNNVLNRAAELGIKTITGESFKQKAGSRPAPSQAD